MKSTDGGFYLQLDGFAARVTCGSILIILTKVMDEVRVQDSSTELNCCKTKKKDAKSVSIIRVLRAFIPANKKSIHKYIYKYIYIQYI